MATKIDKLLQQQSHAQNKLLEQLLSYGKKGAKGSNAGEMLSKTGTDIANKSPDGLAQLSGGLLEGLGAGMNMRQQREQAQSEQAMQQRSIDMLEKMNSDIQAQITATEAEQAEKIKQAQAFNNSAGGLIALSASGLDPNINGEEIKKSKRRIATEIMQNAGIEQPLAKTQDTTFNNINVVIGQDESGNEIYKTENIPSRLRSTAMGLPDPNQAKMLVETANALEENEFNSIARQRVANEKTKAENQTQAVLNQKEKLNPATNYDIEGAKAQGKSDAKARATLTDELNTYEQQLDSINDLRNILKTEKVITGNTLMARGKRLFGELTGSDEYSATELYDATANALFRFGLEAVKFGNMNQKEFEFLLESIPKAKKNRAAIESMLNRFESVINKQQQRANNILPQLPDYRPNATQPQQAQSTDAPMSDDSGGSKMIKINGQLIDVNQLTAEQRQKLGI